MQVLVTYYSGTGNTKKLAEAVVKGVKSVDGVDAALKAAADVREEDFDAAQGIIAGSPNYFGSMAAQLKAMFERFVHLRSRTQNKVGAAFATSGDVNGGMETTLTSILKAMLIYGMIVVGDPLDATGHYGVTAAGEPDDGKLEDAEKLGRRVAELVKKLYS